MNSGQYVSCLVPKIRIAGNIGYNLQLRIQDFPHGGRGADLRCGHFLAEMYAKTKELGLIKYGCTKK